MNVYECKICGKLFSGRKKKYCSQACSDEARRLRNKARWRKDHPDWDKDVNKICEYCGKDFSVPARNAHIARFCSDDCRYTFHSREKGIKPIDEWITIREKHKRKRQAKLDKERLIRSLRTTLTKVIKLREEEERINELTRECVECGEMFYNPSPNVLTCSPECSRKRSRRISRTIYKGRINDNNLIDKNITLTKLYNRDNGICYLCGEHCDWNDKVITDEGYTIVGGSYPTIEHVIPLSKGGKHSWNNIKLACMKCNTLKRDKIIDIKDEREIV